MRSFQPSLSRRSLLGFGAMTAISYAAPASGQLAVQAYIFQQYAERSHKPLAEVVDQVFPMAANAGFHQIELMQSLLTADLRDRTLAAVRSAGLRVPCVYVGGPLHLEAEAAATIEQAVQLAGLCAPLGCRAVVMNADPKRGGARKTDAELAVESEALSHAGTRLTAAGFQLRVHHHTPQLVDDAREWKHILRHTDPSTVFLCIDLDWAYEAGFDPLVFLRDARDRVREVHIRSAKNKVWLEDLEDSDIDYRAIAAYLKRSRLHPQITVELAYRTNTTVTRNLTDDLRRSRIYAERIFRVKA